MNKNFTISEDKCYVTDDYGLIQQHENTENLYEELTLENELESYKNKIEKLKKEKKFKNIKFLIFFDLSIISFIILVFSLIIYLRTLGIATAVFNIICGLFTIKSINNIDNIQELINEIEDRFFEKEIELNKIKHTNLLEEEKQHPRIISKEEYDNIQDKHIINLNTDFTKEYENIEKNIKIKKKIKKI